MKKSTREPLVGSWIKRGGSVVADGIELEIERILRDELRHIAYSDDGWEQLLLDKVVDEYWELTFPEGELHGGGPRMLSPVTNDYARTKYGI